MGLEYQTPIAGQPEAFFPNGPLRESLGAQPSGHINSHNKAFYMSVLGLS